MAILDTSDRAIETAILKAVQKELDVIVEEEATQAAENVKTRITKLLPAIALSIFEYADIQFDGRRLTIRVELKGVK